ncbi:UNVERIFIED_CONTAM: hypothetical protein FKN15_058138 [Acipenser sinensis]
MASSLPSPLSPVYSAPVQNQEETLLGIKREICTNQAGRAKDLSTASFPVTQQWKNGPITVCGPQ